MPATSVRSKCSGVTAMRRRVDRGEVGPRLVVEARVGAVDPVAAALVLVLGGELELVAVDALAQARDLDALRLAGRDVDVEQRALGERHVVELVHDARDELGGDLEVELAAEAEVHLAGRRLLGDGDARDPEDDPLERGGDRPGVRDVVAEVGAVVDPGHDDVGLEAVDEPELGEPDAVDGRAVGRVADRPVVEVDLLDPERPARRDHPRHRRPVPVRRDDGELDVRELQQRAAERLQPLGLDAVVVGQQHAHVP